MIDKRLAIQQAAALVPSHCTLALGGMTIYRRPIAFVRALMERFYLTGEPKGLTLLSFTAGLESDLLVGAGMVEKVRSCYFGLEIFGLAPMFTYYANRGEIEVVEETELSLSCGLRAQAAGVGFLPGRGWLGTDLPRLRPDVKTVIDPYSGETLMAFPAIKPDVTVIHALRSDCHGNAQIGLNKGVDEELALTGGTVMITTEEDVWELERADIVSPFVNWVVLAKSGAAPTSCHPLYALDGLSILEYSEQVSDPKTFDVYVRSHLLKSSGSC